MEIFSAKELPGLTWGFYLCRFMFTIFRTGSAWEWTNSTGCIQCYFKILYCL